jgi:protein subunit release factor A
MILLSYLFKDSRVHPHRVTLDLYQLQQAPVSLNLDTLHFLFLYTKNQSTAFPFISGIGGRRQ